MQKKKSSKMQQTLSFAGILDPISLIIIVFALLCGVVLIKKTSGTKRYENLPPGSFGLPFLGETLDLLAAGKLGKPEKFFQDRMEKYNAPLVFKTSLLGGPMAVFCGPSGNKFLYSNENKLVQQWWPTTVQKLFESSILNMVGDEAKMMRRMLMTFLNRDALLRYIAIMDSVTQQHFSTHWEGKTQISAYFTIKLFTFELACRLFMSIEDPIHVKKLADPFHVFLKGVIAIPINLPGTRLHSAIKASRFIRKYLISIATQRKKDLEEGKASPTQDLMSYLLVSCDENGKFLSYDEIADQILSMLIAGHDTSTSALSMLIKILTELPSNVFERVYSEQMEIAEKKEAGELMKWEDIRQMKYSWDVVCEVMRLWPPGSGGFKIAIEDFTYAGYTIPKGWKLTWSSNATHKDSSLYPNKEEFDASRFEGTGPAPYTYVPFGGGARVCLGKEYARLQILVFLHNLIKRFKWNLVVPDEKVEYDPMPTPVQGLPISLRPHQIQ